MAFASGLLRLEHALRSRRDLFDQLQRAAHSVVLNIAEGSAEVRSAEKARFYRIARRSSWESGAALDLIEASGLVPPEDLDRLRTANCRSSSLLTGLILSINGRRSRR